ncbi:MULTISPECIES: hypothetical protein [Mycolicibacterium]|uniref:hypothetical protein n=1 Tax=Mycolicibacterium TaxID=1866885 RepID=UPI0008494D41|nr:hypothetical protein [Mycolicibacterium porcinum]ODR16752.1 hypothetical protein BHQ19_30530 [Mycolicibacterium porcinum]
MSKYIPDGVLDDMLEVISQSCTRITICSTQPTTYTEANATYALANVTVDSSDFTAANGDTSGRKITVAQQTGLTITATDTAAHIALLDVSNSTLLAVTTCTSQPVTTGNTATINSFDIELSDVA